MWGMLIVTLGYYTAIMAHRIACDGICPNAPSDNQYSFRKSVNSAPVQNR